MRRFLRDDTGATSIEYGLIAGMISMVIVVSLTLMGGNLQILYDAIAARLVAALSQVG